MSPTQIDEQTLRIDLAAAPPLAYRSGAHESAGPHLSAAPSSAAPPALLHAK